MPAYVLFICSGNLYTDFCQQCLMQKEQVPPGCTALEKYTLSQIKKLLGYKIFCHRKNFFRFCGRLFVYPARNGVLELHDPEGLQKQEKEHGRSHVLDHDDIQPLAAKFEFAILSYFINNGLRFSHPSD